MADDTDDRIAAFRRRVAEANERGRPHDAEAWEKQIANVERLRNDRARVEKAKEEHQLAGGSDSSFVPPVATPSVGEDNSVSVITREHSDPVGRKAAGVPVRAEKEVAQSSIATGVAPRRVTGETPTVKNRAPSRRENNPPDKSPAGEVPAPTNTKTTGLASSVESAVKTTGSNLPQASSVSKATWDSKADVTADTVKEWDKHTKGNQESVARLNANRAAEGLPPMSVPRIAMNGSDVAAGDAQARQFTEEDRQKSSTSKMSTAERVEAMRAEVNAINSSDLDKMSPADRAAGDAQARQFTEEDRRMSKLDPSRSHQTNIERDTSSGDIDKEAARNAANPARALSAALSGVQRSSVLPPVTGAKSAGGAQGKIATADKPGGYVAKSAEVSGAESINSGIDTSPVLRAVTGGSTSTAGADGKTPAAASISGSSAGRDLRCKGDLTINGYPAGTIDMTVYGV